MKVICKGHKTCGRVKECDHSVAHEWDDHRCKQKYNYPDKCNCSDKYLRAEKLKKINGSNL